MSQIKNISFYLEEHKEIYEKLDLFLNQFSSLKNQRDDKFLLQVSQEFYSYIQELLLSHFDKEETNLFPNIKEQLAIEIYNRLLDDHEEIRQKFIRLKNEFADFEKSPEAFDYKTKILFPSYNLIATINHHAQREDKYLAFDE
jgi:iron-sulfur cluster repair protein YtfE (RIC family)